MCRVLHLFVTLPVGGAENLLLSILRGLDSRQFDSLVCCIGERGPIGDQVAAMGVPIVALGLLDQGGHDRRVVPALVELIRRKGIGLVHSHLYHANLYGRLAARKAGVPCVASIHNTYIRPKLHRRLANWYLARHTSALIAGSEEIRRDIIRYDRVDPGLVHVIPNAIDLSRSESTLSAAEAKERLGLASGTVVLGTLGRLEEQKGHRFLLDALAILRRQGLPVHLLLAGDGRERESLEAQAAALGLSDRISFLGTRSDIGDLFRAMDVFVMPSLWEGLSLAMLSAMAAGLPVVATGVGGVGQVLGENEFGRVVPPGDAAALAAAVAACLADPAGTSAMAGRGAQRVRDRFSDRTMVASVEKIYRSVLGSRGAARRA